MNINKDTKICVSLASKPGNFGALVHNKCYEHFDLNYIYLPLTTNDFDTTMKWFKNTPNIVGCSVSMPWKKEATKYVNNNKEFKNINTIHKIDDKLLGHNTDLFAIKQILMPLHPDLFKSICIFGDGAMANNFKIALEKKYDEIQILSHKKINNFKYKKQYTMFINATPIGMYDNEITVDMCRLIEESSIVIDCPVSLIDDTSFIKLAKHFKKKFKTGIDLSLLQAAKQFEIYTRAAGEISFYKVYDKMKETINDYRT